MLKLLLHSQPVKTDHTVLKLQSLEAACFRKETLPEGGTSEDEQPWEWSQQGQKPVGSYPHGAKGRHDTASAATAVVTQHRKCLLSKWRTECSLRASVRKRGASSHS